ncbi:hypothetical protein K449DRAFT_369407 [Hypoxylon sp. EC38]|nr:hypothetical protein K449DRAFT_369407 [Hypoxylon sp. EC38]
MATNDSILRAARDISAANITESLVANLTFTEKLAALPSYVWENKDLFILESRLIFTSLALIYLGSHAALRRPPSANPPKKSKKGRQQRDEDREDQYVHGLMLSDAILLPILAGIVLVGFYYLIKWLEDPYLLNKILRVYFSCMSLASMGKLFADFLHFLTGFMFPAVWRAGDGKLYHIDSSKRGQWYTEGESLRQVWDEKKKNPFPGRWSEWKLSDARNALLWEVSQLLVEQWTIRLYIHGIISQKFKVKFNDILGIVLGVGVNVVYYVTQSTFLSNVMGWAFSYTSIIIMSPTAFATGTAVLFGLFLYDIYMVFFTPYMVTVATSLDVPIKLVFEGPTKASMLGLGDIVLPGIFVGLCLRFDQYMYYYRQRKLVPVDLIAKDESTDQLITNTQTQSMVIKPGYVDPQGQWGNRFWSTKLRKILSPDATPALKASAFPKTYFHAAMIGYFVAMVTTLVMLLVYHHAQPALLYLVPGVVFTVWITGMLRGELREMWNYTEDGSLDTADKIVEVDGNGNVIDSVNNDASNKNVGNKPKGEQTMEAKDDAPSSVNSTEQKSPPPNEVREKVGKSKHKAKTSRKERVPPVLLFSIETPDRDGDS